jgi:hypothetical protein
MKKKYIYTYIILMNNSNYFNNEMINNIRHGLNGYLNNPEKKLQHYIDYIQTGGVCPCSKVLDALEKENLDLALYIINEKKCCHMCIDKNGNTILHNLIKYYSNEECYSTILDIINANDAENYINMQNYKGQTPMLLCVINENQDLAIEFENAGARKDLRDNEGNYIASNEDESEVNNNYIKNVVNIYLPKNSIETLNSDDFVNNVQNEVSNMFRKNNYQEPIIESDYNSDYNSDDNSTLNTEQFTKLLIDKNKQIEEMKNEEKKALISKQHNIESDYDNIVSIDNSDMFFKAIKEKYGNDNTNSGKVQVKNMQDSDTLNMSDISNNNNNKFFSKKTNSSKIPSSLLSDSSIINISNNSINSELLKKEISKLNLQSKFNNLYGGGDKHSYSKTYFRNLNSDSIQSVSFNDNSNYHSQSEFGQSDTNEISRMLNNKKSNLHQEVIDSLIDMLNNGIITFKSKNIDANESNAKLVKAYIYKKVSQENPQMTGMDKIMLIKSMSEDEIAKLTKSMPSLESIKKEIEKHMEEKNNSKTDSDNSMSSNNNNKRNNKSNNKSNNNDVDSDSDSVNNSDNDNDNESDNNSKSSKKGVSKKTSKSSVKKPSSKKDTKKVSKSKSKK